MIRNPESARLEAARTAKRRGENGDPTSASGSGVRFARTTARMEMPGTTSLMTRPDPAPITGVRMVLPVSAMTSSCCALAWPCGMAKTPSSKSACSA